MIKDQILRLFDVNYCKLLVQSTNKYDHSQGVFLLPNLNEYYIKQYKRNWFIASHLMKNNKPIAFALFAIELTEIEAAKDGALIRQ